MVVFALGASIATHLVAKEQAGRAIATMFSGLTLAMVLGVPIGSLIGNLWGWRIPLYAVIVFAIIGFIFALKEIPNISLSEKFNLRLQLSTLAQPCILLMLALTVLVLVQVLQHLLLSILFLSKLQDLLRKLPVYY